MSQVMRQRWVYDHRPLEMWGSCPVVTIFWPCDVWKVQTFRWVPMIPDWLLNTTILLLLYIIREGQAGRTERGKDGKWRGNGSKNWIAHNHVMGQTYAFYYSPAICYCPVITAQYEYYPEICQFNLCKSTRLFGLTFCSNQCDVWLFYWLLLLL